MRTKLGFSITLVTLVGLALGACISWTPPYPVPPGGFDVTPTPTPTPTATPTCPFPPVDEGQLFVYFRSDVTEERAGEIVEGLGGFIIPVDLLMSPRAYPEPQPGPDEYGELVEVSPDRQQEFLEGLRAYPEVTRAEEAYWYQCL